MNDLEIVLECQKWKLDLFSSLYEKYVDEIYKFIYLKTYDKELSEDLTSQTFFKAIDKLHTFKVNDQANFRAWLYRVAYHLIVDEYKSRKENVSLEEVVEFWYQNDIGTQIDYKDQLQEILNFFETLNPKHKEILTMRLWDDLSYKEISQITWESLDNCKKIVSRTLAKVPQSQVYMLFLALWFWNISSLLYILK